MNDLQPRLITCFQTVFPELPVGHIPAATQESVPAWDSIAAITLVNVIEDEFQIQMDLDQLADLNSFQKILGYLAKEPEIAPA